MITIQKTLEPLDTFCDFLGYHPEHTLFFDIETTGFSPASSMVFLIGAIFFQEGNWQFTQYLAENQEEEQELVRDFLSLASHFDTLIHFNGATFDIPYLAQKADDYELVNPFPNMQSIDLYQKFRPLKKLLSLERMNQTSLEQFLRYQREDKLTGKHMVSLFQKYAASKEPGIRDLLLLHNHDDLLGMTQILRMCTYLMLPDAVTEPIALHRYEPEDFAFIDTGAANAGFIDTDTDSDGPVNFNTIFALNITLTTPLPHPLDCTIDDIYRLRVRDTNATLTFPAFRGELRYFFADYKNYYYLPLEDQAIHKSIGAYVDKEHRKAARPQTCYVRKTGLFLPQPEAVFEPVFRKSYEDKQLYFEYKDDIKAQCKKLQLYAKYILSRLLQ